MGFEHVVNSKVKIFFIYSGVRHINGKHQRQFSVCGSCLGIKSFIRSLLLKTSIDKTALSIKIFIGSLIPVGNKSLAR